MSYFKSSCGFLLFSLTGFVLSVFMEYGAAALLSWPDLSHPRVDVTHWPVNCSGLGLGWLHIYCMLLQFPFGRIVSVPQDGTATSFFLQCLKNMSASSKVCWLLIKNILCINSPSMNQSADFKICHIHCLLQTQVCNQAARYQSVPAGIQ